jgi:hypothetical protein
MIHLAIVEHHTRHLIADTQLAQAVFDKEFKNHRDIVFAKNGSLNLPQKPWIIPKSFVFSTSAQPYQHTIVATTHIHLIEVLQTGNPSELYPLRPDVFHLESLTDWKQLLNTQYRMLHYKRDARISVIQLTD